MMRQPWPTVFALMGAVVLQVAVAPHVAIAGVVPNFMLLVVVTLALTQGPDAGCVGGFLAGLTLDLLGSGPVGMWALVLCVTGFIAGLLEANLFAQGWLLPVTVVLIAGLGAETAYAIVLSVVGESVAFWSTFWSNIVPGAAYNTFWAVLFYPFLARILRHEPVIRMVRRIG
ncbi:MAG: hypothetical protein Kow0056_04160 [Coriobacteriia bacterium]